MTYDVVYGKKRLIAVYVDSKLVATHDKFTQDNGDFDRLLAKWENEGHSVVEHRGTFARFCDIPDTFSPDSLDSVDEKPELVTQPVKRGRKPKPSGVDNEPEDDGADEGDGAE